MRTLCFAHADVALPSIAPALFLSVPHFAQLCPWFAACNGILTVPLKGRSDRGPHKLPEEPDFTPYSKASNPVPEAGDSAEDRGDLVIETLSVAQGGLRDYDPLLKSAPLSSPAITRADLGEPEDETSTSSMQAPTAAPTPEPAPETYGLPAFLGGGGIKTRTYPPPPPPRQMPTGLPSFLTAFLKSDQDPTEPTAAAPPANEPKAGPQRQQAASSLGLPFAVSWGRREPQTVEEELEEMGASGELDSLEVPVTELGGEKKDSNTSAPVTNADKGKGSKDAKAGSKTVRGQSVSSVLNADTDSVLNGKVMDYGLDVDLDEQNRLVADKAGQILFGAPNGVGINYKPSGDFALDVLGAIYATEPSQLGVSDRRVKTDIRSVNTSDCLDTVRSLQLKDFRFKSTYQRAPKTGRREDGKHRGFIAQEMAEALPSAALKTK